MEKKLVKDHMLHLTTDDKQSSQKGQIEKCQQRQQKSFEKYNCDTSCRTAEFHKLKIQEL